jgi:hypothetical protein
MKRFSRQWFCVSVKTWSVTLRDEHGPRVTENRVLRIFWPMVDKVQVSGGWKQLHNEIKNLYCCQILLEWSNQGRLNGQGIYHTWDKIETRTKFCRKPWNRPIGRLVANVIKVSKWTLKELGSEGAVCIHPAQVRDKYCDGFSDYGNKIVSFLKIMEFLVLINDLVFQGGLYSIKFLYKACLMWLIFSYANTLSICIGFWYI